MGARITAATREQRNREFDAGLHLSRRGLTLGVTRSAEELSWFCGCTRQYIGHIERTALAKLREAVSTDPAFRELMDHINDGLFEDKPRIYHEIDQ